MPSTGRGKAIWLTKVNEFGTEEYFYFSVNFLFIFFKASYFLPLENDDPVFHLAEPSRVVTIVLRYIIALGTVSVRGLPFVFPKQPSLDSRRNTASIFLYIQGEYCHHVHFWWRWRCQDHLPWHGFWRELPFRSANLQLPRLGLVWWTLDRKLRCILIGFSRLRVTHEAGWLFRWAVSQSDPHIFATQ